MSRKNRLSLFYGDSMPTLFNFTRFQPTLNFLTIARVIYTPPANTIENCAYHTDVRVDCASRKPDRAGAVEQTGLAGVRTIESMNGRAASLITEKKKSNNVCRSRRLQCGGCSRGRGA